MNSTDRSSPRRCDFCRLPCPEETHALEYEGSTYEFCSETCRDAVRESDRVFTEYHGHRRVRPGVAGLDAALPQGLPRNSFVLIGGQAGNRTGALQAELAWRTLQRGEPAVLVSFREPPASVLEQFLAMDWNVLPYLERGDLAIVDCFTYRLDDPDRTSDTECTWNNHLRRFTGDAVRSVRDPSDVAEIRHKLGDALDAGGMVDEGAVVIDSLTEFGTLVQPVQAYDFVKNLRADVSKGRFVPVFAGATLQGAGDRFPHDLRYIADGLVDLEMNDDIVDDTLIKRVRVQKMSGVLTYPKWIAYEYTSEDGMVTFSPSETTETEEEPEPDARPDRATPVGIDVGEDAGAAERESPPAENEAVDSPDATAGASADEGDDVE